MAHPLRSANPHTGAVKAFKIGLRPKWITATGILPRCSVMRRPRRATLTKVYLIVLGLWKNGSGFGACTPINPKLCRHIRGWPSAPEERTRSTKRSKSHFFGAHFCIRIDQGHPIRPILDITRIIAVFPILADPINVKRGDQQCATARPHQEYFGKGITRVYFSGIYSYWRDFSVLPRYPYSVNEQWSDTRET